MSLNLPFHQVEAITHRGAYHFYLTNEYIMQYGISIAAKFHKLDLSEYLAPLDPDDLSENENLTFEIYPNPVQDLLYVNGLQAVSGCYEIYNGLGQLVQKGHWEHGLNEISLALMPSSVYFIKVNAESVNKVQRFVKE